MQVEGQIKQKEVKIAEQQELLSYQEFFKKQMEELKTENEILLTKNNILEQRLSKFREFKELFLQEQNQKKQLQHEIHRLNSQKHSIEIQMLNEKQKSELYLMMSQKNLDTIQQNALYIQNLEEFKEDKSKFKRGSCSNTKLKFLNHFFSYCDLDELENRKLTKKASLLDKENLNEEGQQISLPPLKPPTPQLFIDNQLFYTLFMSYLSEWNFNERVFTPGKEDRK